MGGPLRSVAIAGFALTLSMPALAVNDHLQCFKVKDRQAKAIYTADVAGLTVAPGCQIKVPATLLCVEAAKTNVSPPPPGFTGTTAAGKFICYKLKCPRAKVLPMLWTDQFGSRQVEPHNTNLLCAPGTLVPAGPVGTCSVSGGACTGTSDCPKGEVTVTGVCLQHQTTTACIYDSFDPLGTKQVCNGNPAVTESTACAGSIYNATQCPVGVSCGGFTPSLFCPESSESLVYFCSKFVACASNTDCTYTATNSCLFCGNGVKEGNENCDDGNTVDGDGCSSHCVGERTCDSGTVTYGPCSTVADCPSTCGASCTCH